MLHAPSCGRRQAKPERSEKPEACAGKHSLNINAVVLSGGLMPFLSYTNSK